MKNVHCNSFNNSIKSSVSDLHKISENVKLAECRITQFSGTNEHETVYTRNINTSLNVDKQVNQCDTNCNNLIMKS